MSLPIIPRKSAAALGWSFKRNMKKTSTGGKDHSDQYLEDAYWVQKAIKAEKKG